MTGIIKKYEESHIMMVREIPAKLLEEKKGVISSEDNPS